MNAQDAKHVFYLALKDSNVSMVKYVTDPDNKDNFGVEITQKGGTPVTVWELVSSENMELTEEQEKFYEKAVADGDTSIYGTEPAQHIVSPETPDDDLYNYELYKSRI